MLVQLLWNYCPPMYADGWSLEAHPDPNSHSMLLALRIITENDGLVFDSCSIQCFHELLFVREQGPEIAVSFSTYGCRFSGYASLYKSCVDANKELPVSP